MDISIGKIGFSYNGKVDIDDVLIKDHHKDTLVYAREVNTSILSLSSLMDVAPLLGNTVMEGFKMNIKIYKGEERDNLSQFVDKFKRENPSKNKGPFQLSAGTVEIFDSRFSYIDENTKNPDIIVLDDLNILGENLEIDGTDVFVDIRNMSGLEKRGFEIDLLRTNFSYTSEDLDLKNLVLKTPQSEVIGAIHLDIENGFGDFINKVLITALFESASVSTNDLQNFYAELGDDLQLDFSTTFQGTLNNFELQDLIFHGMDRSVLNGELIVQNLFPNENQVFSVQGDLAELSTNYYDLVNLLPGLLREKLPQELTKFGNVRIEGYAVVTTSSLDADVDIFSQLGTADVSMMIGNFNDSNLAT
ncbi:MAG TPA: translocation/assembly module TamB, partial [Salinimicrobium sp.]|nr:translocation/assembly module TamB [Salinimicrobium sp.]